MTGDLPEDILRLRATQESHFGPLGLNKVSCCLQDEDVVDTASEGDIRAEADSYVKDVDTGRQNLVTDVASSEIGPRSVVAGAPSCVVVRGLNVVDRGGQFRGSASSVSGQYGGELRMQCPLSRVMFST
jgi:hypothetical protein